MNMCINVDSTLSKYWRSSRKNWRCSRPTQIDSASKMNAFDEIKPRFSRQEVEKMTLLCFAKKSATEQKKIKMT